MEQVDLITEALNLTLFGMGFVFLFLTLLVFVTKLMSIIIQKIQDSTPVEAGAPHRDEMADELDEEAKFVIEQAIKMHRGA
ncbi:Oxaloacetate decarboxylase Na(+) pump, gamma chain (EC 4.1.1.3) [uncultured Gammaproteobacteria bacterium]|jgi:oxaloacetate decarboxylase gamma subunit|nr:MULTISPECIES: OadG family protein [sulfur-oxidizing symbionts]CAC9433057.1 Oxaloacetate decarboxylase Na(+) pump, gamma chain (EC 4.1.1.3) [uncultured Gammaproteobacteria bacterium]CAB5501034.1 Oxaloacetate decarboxylase Na(+) pump, gamma chain (EC [Bathymodiolus azoricus thioautotrophic gill symbiont]CAB5505311.1 Oxaloacetate decarboxylase Na(+) pump, gamma chain (EC [Bathymodiolus thermophilus thioautotrophic gill symbiont]CAC9482798.1 Oxaloacetate decarboxylase Na(+) pump, gamma chain (EC